MAPRRTGDAGDAAGAIDEEDDEDEERPVTHRLHFIACLLLIPLVATQFGNGCVSDGDGGSAASGQADDRYTSGGGTAAGTAAPSAGSAGGGAVRPGTPRRLPRDVDLVREGHEKIRWTADLDGTVYVYDVDADRIAWTGDVRRGQEVLVDPKRDSVVLGENVVYHDNLGRDALHRIYFTTARQRGGDRGDVISREDRDNREAKRDELEGIPTAAEKLADGRGELQIKTIPADGTVYVYDAEAADDDEARGPPRRQLPDHPAGRLHPRERQADRRPQVGRRPQARTVFQGKTIARATRAAAMASPAPGRARDGRNSAGH